LRNGIARRSNAARDAQPLTSLKAQKAQRFVALAISSPAFQRFETKSPPAGKDRQRHNAGFPLEQSK
jgi:hypothetical protein